MSSYLVGFQDIRGSDATIVGGKGANLGALSRLAGVQVPEGFCISTAAYKNISENNPALQSLLSELTRLATADRQEINAISAKIRRTVESISIPEEISEEIKAALKIHGENDAYAIRSSATAEDLPTASFAGQQDTYLNVIGITQILTHIGKCWASLFTERAIIYRLQNGFDHRNVQLSVVVQKMILSQAAGIMFTADPVSSNRKLLSIDAGFGLGEAMVSGLVIPDNYKVYNGTPVEIKISIKKLAIYPQKGGGTKEKTIDPDQQNKRVLTDGQIVALDRLGRRIEKHFGCPQDIEWCLADGVFYIVQSRPITTLYPIPEVNDQKNHVFISVGHQQMMTDAMKPFGLSFWLLTTSATMYTAGGRLFVDISQQLNSAVGRQKLMAVLGKSEPLLKDALETIMGREEFIKELPEDKKIPGEHTTNSVFSWAYSPDFDNNPKIAAELIRHMQLSLETLKQDIENRSGVDLFDFILGDLPNLKSALFNPKGLDLIMVVLHASTWINENMMIWLAEKNAADIISRSVPNNITSEMGLDLLGVADVIRPFPEVINYLRQEVKDDFLDSLPGLHGGTEAREAIENYLRKYGMRCAGEIDITRTRWSEKPAILVPMILGNIKNFGAQAGDRKFELGQQESLKKERELINRLEQLPDGKEKALEAKRMIGLIRNFAGYREYPKYALASRYFVYKQALLKEAAMLVQAGVIQEKEDVFYLHFGEFREVVRTKKFDQQIIADRKKAYQSFKKLTPPRVITSDGEIIEGKYKREDLPVHALAGLAVSSGIIEGRARVILSMADANLEDGDILITSFTDPSWTPLFVSIKGLVTEVGGMMTHGSVIAREYGLPAVVAVENATRLIKDGQRIRVNGTEGYVELL